MVDNTSLTGAALLIDALQANGLNNMYGRSMKVKKQFDSQLEKEGYAFYSIYDFRRNVFWDQSQIRKLLISNCDI